MGKFEIQPGAVLKRTITTPQPPAGETQPQQAPAGETPQRKGIRERIRRGPSADAAAQEAARKRQEEIDRQQVKQYEVLDITGAADRKIKLPRDVQQEAVAILKARLETIRDVQKLEQRPLDIFGVLITEDTIARWEKIVAGEEALTQADLALIHYEVFDQLFQRSVAAARLVRMHPGRLDELKRVPFIGYLAQRPQAELDRIFNAQVTSPEIKRWNIDNVDSKLLRQNIKKLADLYVQLEEAAFLPQKEKGIIANLRVFLEGGLKGFRHPLWEETNAALKPFDFTQRTGNKFHDRIVDTLQQYLQAKHEGATITEVLRRDPLSFARLLYDAERTALETFCDEQALAITKEGNFAEDEIEKIKENARRRREARLPEGEEEITEEHVQHAEERVAALRERVANLERQLEELNRPHLEKQREREQVEARIKAINGELRRLKTQITDIQQNISPMDPRTAPPGQTITPDQIDSYNKAIIGAQNMLTPLLQQYAELAGTLPDLQSQLATIKFEESQEQQRLDDKKDQVKQLKDQLTNARQALVAAEQEANDRRVKREEQLGRLQEASPYHQRQAYILEKWLVVVENYSNIIDRLRDTRRYPQFSRRRLTDTTRIVIAGTERIAGAEQIRKLVLDTIKENQMEFRYNEATDWEILPEYLIARKIIEHFGLDMQRDYGIDMNDLDSKARRLIYLIGLVRQNHPDRTDRIKFLEQIYRRLGCDLLEKVLPVLRAQSQFGVETFIHELIRDRIEAAANDHPLELDPYRPPEVPLQEEAAAIAKESLGNVDYQDIFAEEPYRTRSGLAQITAGREIYYQADNLAFNVPTGHAAIPEGAVRLILHTKDLGGPHPTRSISGRIEIQANPALLDALPATRTEAETMGWDTFPELLDHFYNLRGNLQRNRADGTWINVTSVLGNLNRPRALTNVENVEAILNCLSPVIPDIKQHFYASLGEYFVSLTDDEQAKKIFGGFSASSATIKDIDWRGTRRSFQVRMDNNGRRWIRDVTDPNNPGPDEEIHAFYNRELEAERQALGVRNLNPEQRRNFQQRLRLIQEAIGREVVRVFESHRFR